MRSPTLASTPEEEKALAAEKRIAWVRFAVIVFNVAAFYLLLPDGLGIPWLAASISVIALAYGAFVAALQPYRWLPILRAAMFTALTDGALILLWVLASGGFASPFHLLWFLSLIAVAFRYEWKATLVATGFYIGSYVGLVVVLDQLAGNGVSLLIRCAYIALSGVLGALLAYDSSQLFAARARLQADLVQERLRHEAQELERLREVDHLKSEFINAAAHELNTPLTPIQLQLHLLENPQDAAGRQRSLAVLRRSTARLTSLVQNMLDIARLQSGRLLVRPQTVNLLELAQGAVESYQPLADQKEIRLTLLDREEAAFVNVDPERVAQILDNLLSNAIKFTPAGGQVRCSVKRQGSMLAFCVEDTGVGFDPAQTQDIFQAFGRLHADVLPEPGTGLGLYICRGLAERHGGRLEAYSDGPGRGARFTCLLPAATPLAQA